jgi:BirA family transcriptional regulator, biotin operon repressor / biotin---[acetyl-CoA-carboxylase] ligase
MVYRSNNYRLAELRTAVKPFRVGYFARLRSTSDHAARMRRERRIFAPAMVLTSHQLAGRGRGSNTWFSSDGCITATFVLAVDESAEAHQLPLSAGIAVRNAAAELTGNAGIQLKWPNDVLFEGKKLAGLLCERIDNADLIGLGMNVNVSRRDVPKNLRERATSLSEIRGQSIDMTTALATIASHLHRTVSRRAERPFAETLREYDRHHALFGKHVTVRGEDETVRGTCEGLDAMGRLLLRDRSTVHHVIAGHVESFQ